MRKREKHTHTHTKWLKNVRKSLFEVSSVSVIIFPTLKHGECSALLCAAVAAFGAGADVAAVEGVITKFLSQVIVRLQATQLQNLPTKRFQFD